jgi:hypothetical protein
MHNHRAHCLSSVDDNFLQELEADIEVIYPNPNKQVRVRTPKVKFVEMTPEPSMIQG